MSSLLTDLPTELFGLVMKHLAESATPTLPTEVKDIKYANPVRELGLTSKRCRELMKGNMSPLSSMSVSSKGTVVLGAGAFMRHLRSLSNDPDLYSADLFTDPPLRQEMLTDPLTLVRTLVLPLGPSENETDIGDGQATLNQFRRYSIVDSLNGTSFPELECLALDRRIRTRRFTLPNSENLRSDRPGEEAFCKLLSGAAVYARDRHKPFWICVNTEKTFDYRHRLSDMAALLEWTGTSLDLPRLVPYNRDTYNPHAIATRHKIRINMTGLLQGNVGEAELTMHFSDLCSNLDLQMGHSTSRQPSTTEILLFTDAAEPAVHAKLDGLESAFKSSIDGRTETRHHLSVTIGHEAPASIADYNVDPW